MLWPPLAHDLMVASTGVRYDITNNAWNDAWNVAMKALRVHCDPPCYCKATGPCFGKPPTSPRSSAAAAALNATANAGLRRWGAISTSSSDQVRGPPSTSAEAVEQQASVTTWKSIKSTNYLRISACQNGI